MLTKQTKIIASSSLVLCVLFGVLLIVLWRFIQHEGARLDQQVVEVVNFEAKEQSYRELSQLVEETKMQQEELLSYVLTEEGTVAFLAEVESLATAQGITLETNTLKRIPQEKGIFDTLVITYTVEGTHDRILKLLRLFETLPYMSSVTKFSLQSSSKDNDGKYTGTIELTVNLLQYDR